MTLKLESYRSIVIDVGTGGLIKKSSEYLEYLKESALLVIFFIVETNK